MPDGPRCVIAPEDTRPWLDDAVRAGGGRLVDAADAEVLVWADPGHPERLRAFLDDHPGIAWVQLPWAGIEPFVGVLDHDRIWTCGKGVYAEPVAEHALGLTLAGMRAIAHYARQRSWTRGVGRNLLGARVSLLGGGEITRALLALLAPFGCETTVMTRHPRPIEGAGRVVGPDDLDRALDGADVLVLALALTPETTRIVDADALARLPDHAWLVNVARGRHVDTDALVTALREDRLGGAALDVTDPEPLPDGHPLWELPNVVITPHTANTPEMGRPLLARRVEENIRRYASDQPLLGPVDVALGY